VANRGRSYDRRFLLFGPKRDQVLNLWEVQRYGADSFGDPDHVSLFGMPTAEWYAKGIRIQGRTAVECTRDALGDAIGKEIAAVARTTPLSGRALVIDPFLGSGNTLYWILRHIDARRGLGFESDSAVFALTSRNLARLSVRIEVVNTDYRSGLSDLAVESDQLLIMFIAPPWGHALRETTGLNLRLTAPPVLDVIDFVCACFPQNRLLFAIQMLETTDRASISDLEARFAWSTSRVFNLNAPRGLRPGVLIGTRGWTPPSADLP
jgi:hypothetical protein